MWAWAHAVNTHRHNWGIELDSKMTPVGGAKYLGVPNIFMMLPPYKKEAEKAAGFRRIIWQLTFEKNFEFTRDLECIENLAEVYPNIEGIILDDMIAVEAIERGLKPQTLAKLRDTLQQGTRPLSLWGTLYTKEFEHPGLGEYLKFLDVITLWTWVADDLDNLEHNLCKAEELVAGKPIWLGLYMYDYGTKKQMPVERMRFQCEKALQWVKTNRIDGMIFLATCITDLGFETVEWTQQWIQKVGEESMG